MQGTVEAVCSGTVKSLPKEEQREIELKPGLGVVGDAHAGSAKEVSLVAREDVEELMLQTGIDAPPGSFAENIATRGIVLMDLAVGTRLSVGEAEIQVLELGKDPLLSHTYSYQGYSLLPTRGCFAKVLKAGKVRKGDPVRVLSGVF